MDYSLALREKNPLLFRQEYLGNFVEQCSVRDNKGNHCPEVPAHYIERNGERVGLCERCFQNYQNGAFDKQRAKRVAVEDRLTSADSGSLKCAKPHFRHTANRCKQ